MVTKLLIWIIFTCLIFIEEFQSRRLFQPIVINTWNFPNANAKAWEQLAGNLSALDAVEHGCSQCEIDQCDGTVGWGSNPSESGETTLDAMIMDGQTYDVGAVAGLRRIKDAISVARLVLERTSHSLLVGEMATQFAIQFGFNEESLTSDKSKKMFDSWLKNSCQPNFWKNVIPDPKKNCGPYHLKNVASNQNRLKSSTHEYLQGHDTIGMIAIDSMGRVASGTSTNGLAFKIPGRAGDSPIPGSGSYAAKEAGAAAATGDGDMIMRHLLSYQAVENMRMGMTPQSAANDVIQRLSVRSQSLNVRAAVIVLSKDGFFGSACIGFKQFPFVVSDSKLQSEVIEVACIS